MYQNTIMEFEENIRIIQYLKKNPNPDIQKQIHDDQNESKFLHISFESESEKHHEMSENIDKLQNYLTMWHESISNPSDTQTIKIFKNRVMNWVNSNLNIKINQLPDETLYLLEIFNRYYEMQIYY